MRCSFRSPQNLSCSHSLVYGPLHWDVRACVRPSVRPARGCLSPSSSICVHLPLPLGRQQPPGFAEVHVWGDSPCFSDQGACSRSRAGRMQGLLPSPVDASSQEPSPPRGFSSQAFWQRQPRGPCCAGSVHLLVQNMFPYLYVQGMGLVASSKPTSVYSVN